MKEKIIDYLERLEAKAYQSDDYFKQRNELYISNQEKDKEIQRLNNIIEELELCIKQNCEIIRFTDEEGNLVDKIGNIDGARLLNYIDKLKELKEEVK